MKTLNKTIRKNLLETKENKKNLLVEERIICGRYNFLLESFRSKKKIGIDKIFFATINESKTLR